MLKRVLFSELEQTCCQHAPADSN